MTCRPDKITCRWLREMTLAIHIECPSIQPIEKCTNTETQWSSYLDNLRKNQKCYKKVEPLLLFHKDYNDILVSALGKRI